MKDEKKLKSQLLETFKFTVDFLNKNNLTWWVAYGTAIGTVRHKGLIPWDDDIDIMMPRDDYNKLLLLRKELEDTNYRIASLDDDGYYCPYAKLYDNRTTVWEVKRFPFLIGVWVDIFPMDLSNGIQKFERESVAKFSKKVNHFEKSIAAYTVSDFCSMFKEHHFKTVFDSFVSLICYRPFKKYYVARLKDFIAEIQKQTGDNYILYYKDSVVRSYPKSYFNKTLVMPFEDFLVKIPAHYHEILTVEYGDYMTPPPIHKRNSTHNQFYVSLSERLQISDIL